MNARHDRPGLKVIGNIMAAREKEGKPPQPSLIREGVNISIHRLERPGGFFGIAMDENPPGFAEFTDHHLPGIPRGSGGTSGLFEQDGQGAFPKCLRSDFSEFVQVGCQGDKVVAGQLSHF